MKFGQSPTPHLWSPSPKGNQSLVRAKLSPLSLAEFRTKLCKLLLAQVALSGLFFLIYRMGKDQDLPHLQLLSFALFLPCSIVAASLGPKYMSRRLVSLYPECKQRHRLSVLILLLGPVGIAGVTTGLFFKHGEGLPVPKFMKKWALTSCLSISLQLGIMIIPGLFFTGVNSESNFRMSALSYWISNPTTHYIVRLSDEVKDALSIKNSYNRLDPATRSTSFLFDRWNYHESTTTGAMLILSVAALDHIQNSKQRSPANADQKKLAESAFMEDIIRVFELKDRGKDVTHLFNPLSFILGSGAVEIGLISFVVCMLEFKIDLIANTKIKTIREKLMVDAINPQKSQKLSELWHRYEQTKTFRVANYFESSQGRGIASALRLTSLESLSLPSTGEDKVDSP